MILADSFAFLGGVVSSTFDAFAAVLLIIGLVAMIGIFIAIVTAPDP
jgi:hypothetical protein